MYNTVVLDYKLTYILLSKLKTSVVTVTNIVATDSVVDIVTELRSTQPRNRGSTAGWGKRFFCSSYRPYRLWDPQNLPFTRQRSCSPEVKRAGRKSNHSPSSNVELKKDRSCSSGWTGNRKL